MIDAFVKAFAQLPDRRIRSVVILGLIAALVVYVLLAVGLAWALSSTAVVSLPWVDALVDVLGGVAVFVLSLLFFPALTTVVIGFFLEQVADAVEDRHYPGLPPNREQPLAEVLGTTVKFAAITVGLNLVALPLYLFLMLVPPMSLVLFYALNGYLLSREYFEVVALRRADPATVRTLRKRHMGRLWLVGAIITFLSTVPFVNIVAAVVGTAAMTHVTTRLMRRHDLLPDTGAGLAGAGRR
ncbi:MAG: EI24 domain-containing protein [Caenispirillum bisanense]|nr:EI24 domain-containing protein [Caenispirillum bisanense]